MISSGKFVFLLLSLLLVAHLIDANRRPPIRPQWRIPPSNQHPGRGGMPIPIHENNFAHRRIPHGPPPRPHRPPLRNKIPPPAYFNRHRRPPPPPYGGYMRPPPFAHNNHIMPHQYGYPSPPNFPQPGLQVPISNPTLTTPVMNPTLAAPTPSSTQFQQNQRQQQHQFQQTSHQHQQSPQNPQQPPQNPQQQPPQNPQQQPPQNPQQPQQFQQNPQKTHQLQQNSQQQQQQIQHNQQQQQQSQQNTQKQQQFQQNSQQNQQYQHSSPQSQQKATHQQQLGTPQTSQSSHPQYYNGTGLQKTQRITGTIQPSQQTSQSNQHSSVINPDSMSPSQAPPPQSSSSSPYMTVIKPDSPNSVQSSSSQQVYQFHLPQVNNQPSPLIQIHLSTTPETPKDSGNGKDYFTGSTFKPQPYDTPQSYPNTEYKAYEKPTMTPSPPPNYKQMNADKLGIHERPIIYKNSKEVENSYKNKNSKYGQPIVFTTESPKNQFPWNKRPSSQSHSEYESTQDLEKDSPLRQEYGQPSFSNLGYEHSLTPPTKNDYGFLSPLQKEEYGLSALAKTDYEKYKHYKEYANKYSQLDPLYHPHGDLKGSNEDLGPDLTVPNRYDNSFSTNYKHDDYEDVRRNDDYRKPLPYGSKKHHPQPEEILSALGISTNPLDHKDIVQTAKEQYRKEPLYSLPDRQVDDEEFDPDDSSHEMGYPGTSYNMHDKKAMASRTHMVKRPHPEISSKIKGLMPPSLSAHTPDHRDDIITADLGEESYYGPRISEREDVLDYAHPLESHQAHSSGHPSHGYGYGQHEYDRHKSHSYGYRHRPNSAPLGYTDPSPTPAQSHGYPIYVTEPDPIIEIIVQDSNFTLPPPPRPPTTTPAPITPEPVHVFYVRYSTDKNKSFIGAGSETHNLKLDSPVPAVAIKGPDGHFRPPSPQSPPHFNYHHYNQPQASQLQPNYAPPAGSHYNRQQLSIRNQQQPQGSHYTSPSAGSGASHFSNNPNNHQLQQSGSHYSVAQVQPPATATELSTTTMRAVIRPDKNEYESNHLKVAFDHMGNPFSHLQEQQSEAQGTHNQYTPENHQQKYQPQAQNQAQQFPPQGSNHQQFSQQQLQQSPSPPPNQFYHNQNPNHQHQLQSQQQQFGNRNQHPQARQQQFQNHQQHQFSTKLTNKLQIKQPQFLNQPAPQQSQTVPQSQQYQSPVQNRNQDAQAQSSQYANQFQFLQSQNSMQFQQGNQGSLAVPSQEVAKFQLSTHESQHQYPSESQANVHYAHPTSLSPSDPDFNMDPMWTTWNQSPQNVQHQQFDQNSAASTNKNQQVSGLPSQNQPVTQGQTPMINYAGGQPLGLGDIGVLSSMRFENTAGLRPPPGPVYPKTGGFHKRVGLEDLAALMTEESSSDQGQVDAAQEQEGQDHQSQQSQESSILHQQPQTSITASYHDPDMEQQKNIKNQQQQLQSYQDKINKLPDDVPDELKQELINSGILGNADVQVIDYDKNLFKDLTNLPTEGFETFQGSDELSKLLASSASTNRPVRSILVVNETSFSLREKRKKESNKLVLFVKDTRTLIYNPKTHSMVTVGNNRIQNIIDHSHHKNY